MDLSCVVPEVLGGNESRWEEDLLMCDTHFKPGMCYWAAVKIGMKYDFNMVGDWEYAWDPDCYSGACGHLAWSTATDGSGHVTEKVHEHCQDFDAEDLRVTMVVHAEVADGQVYIDEVVDLACDGEGVQVQPEDQRNGMQIAPGTTSRKRRQRRKLLKQSRAVC